MSTDRCHRGEHQVAIRTLRHPAAKAWARSSSCRTSVAVTTTLHVVKSPVELSERARELAGEVKADLRYERRDGDGFGGFWTFKTEELEAVVIARAASALGFLSSYAGSESEWFKRARIAWEAKGDNTS